MKWENKVNEMCFLRNQRAWFIKVTILGLFLGFGLLFLISSIFLTSSIILILSTTYILTLSNPKPHDHENNNKTLEEEQLPKHLQEQDQEQEREELVMSSVSSTISDSDYCLDNSSDYDGSISDEESLIEIALPSGHFVGHYESYDSDKVVMPDNKFLSQRILMELLAEINELNNIEEDNFIEIDISMGSIKCSRFEIEA